MNEAKEYDTLEMYQLRDDKKYKQKIDETLHQINVSLEICRMKSRSWHRKRPEKKRGSNILRKRKERRQGRRPLKN